MRREAPIERHQHSARGTGRIALCTVLVGVALGFGCGRHETLQQVHLTDIGGRRIDPLRTDTKATVFFFTRSDCPISNRYAPEVQRLANQYAQEGVTFFLVYLDNLESEETLREHVRDYSYTVAVLRDPDHDLVRLAGATITPEAAVFVQGREMVYRGRIDDRYVDFGTARIKATTHDLRNALDAVLAGKPVPAARTKAVGCYIADLQ